MIKKRLLTLFFALCVSSLAGQIKITGVVVGPDGPLVGAMVSVKGTSTGTTTDFNGKFALKAANLEKDILAVQYIGMNPVEYPLAGKVDYIEIRMVESPNDLDDVVVIGYGTARRGDLTGSIATVSGKTLASQPMSSVAEALQGRVAGVQITTQDGAPDADVVMLVRGGTSINNDNSPLFIVDGFAVENINDIPPSDIESVSILKDASSTAIYGARGANGVVIVTTRQGQAGKTQVSLTAYTQWRTLAKKLDVMDPYEFTKLYYEYASVNTSSMSKFHKNFGHPGDLYIYKGFEGYDWQEDIMGRTPTTQFYTLNVSGGSKQTTFNFGMSFNRVEGQHIGTSTDRIALNYKMKHEASKNVRLEFNTRYSNVKNLGSNSVNPLEALTYRPVNGIRDFVEISEDDMDLAEEEVFKKYPPSEETRQNWKENAKETLNLSGALVWSLGGRVTARSEFGLDILSHSLKRNFYGTESSRARKEGNGQPLLSMTEGTTPKYKWTNTVTWDVLKSKIHTLNMMFGHEAMSEYTKTSEQNVMYFPVNTSRETAFNNLALGETITNMTDKSKPVNSLSFFGRAMYNYKKTYFFDATFRADASSKFEPEHRWSYFPSAAFMWRISNMDFLKDYRPLSNLKLRLSYGSAGNDRIPVYASREYYTLKTSLSTSPGFDQSKRQTYLVEEGTYQSNRDLKWETTWQANIGIDFGFFDERLNGTFELYHNRTTDLLVLSETPISSGYTNQWRNIGQTSARGIEFTLNGRIFEKNDWSISSTFNIGINRSRVDKLASGEEEWQLFSNWASSQRGADDYRVIVGQPIGLMYGFVYDGYYTVDDFQRDANGAFILTDGKHTLKPGVVSMASYYGSAVKPGDMKFKKITPAQDSEINPSITDDDRQIIGRAEPKFTGGFGVNAAWKGFDLSVFFNFMYGFDVLNGVKGKLTSMRNPTSYDNLSARMVQRFRYVDERGTLLLYDANALETLNRDAAIYNPISIKNAVMMSWLIEDGSFLRLNNLTLGYTFPARWTRKAGVNHFRLYVTGNNLWLWTKYSGYDPEVNMKSTSLTPNVDYDKTYPRSRVYTVGANLKF